MAEQKSAGQILKETFAEWAPTYYRTVKPDPEVDMYDDDGHSDEAKMQAYRDRTPLLADVDPKRLEIIITNFNRLIDTYEKHYEKPAYLRTLLTDTPLSKKSSNTLSEFFTDLIEHQQAQQEKLGHYNFHPGDDWRTVYVQACNLYAKATGHQPMRPKNAIAVRKIER